MKELEKKLGYSFVNKELLKQALTRESAILEKKPNASNKSYQPLELLGDAALKFVLARYFIQHYSNLSESEAHEFIKGLVGNDDVLPKIGKTLGLEKYLIRGNGENEVTPKMYADGVEAVLGAISLDNNSQKVLLRVVADLWKPYIDKFNTSNTNAKKAEKIEISHSNNQSHFNHSNNSSDSSVLGLTFSYGSSSTSNPPKPQPKAISVATSTASSSATADGQLSPRTQRMFSSIGNAVSIEEFSKYIKEVPDINRKNIGKKGDTALMMLLRKDKLREGKEISKIEVLLWQGASWDTKNNRGESANDLAKKHDTSVIAKLKATKCNSK